ncbi:hypothetical protein GQR58_000282 [Nymphon striatum]|nr:hypothetical protein GQR58_000282 [Nymphon striatum]
MALGLAVAAQHAFADGDIIKSHGISTFGDLKYSSDFEHLDYVNPNAPKGGEISLWAPGRSGALASSLFESMLTSTADEIGAEYGLIAESLEYPEDKSWVIFNMRPEVTFSDGSPLTAEDAAFTFNLFLTEGLVSYRAVLSQVVEKVEVLDTYRIKYTFKEDVPKRDAIQMVGGLPIKSKKWFEDNEAGLDESRLDPALGSAPYVLDSYDINQRVVYKRNPDYWGNDLPINLGRNNFDRIRIEYFADSNAAFEGFKSGAYTFRNENSSKTWATGETAAESVFNSMGIQSEAVDKLIDIAIEAESRDELHVATRALDRVLRAEMFWVPQWFKDSHTVAYFDMYEYPDPLPPFALGQLDFWWVNPEKEAALKASGALK